MSVLLNQLSDNPGARRGLMRVGRGIGSGKGKTCGRGGKGQTARTGVAINGFEGGQMPIYRRLPKRGFKSRNRVDYAVVNLDDLQKLLDSKLIKAGASLDIEELRNLGLVRGAQPRVKLLAKGECKAPLNLTVHKASEAAVKALEAAGGSITLLTPAQEEATVA